MVARAADIRRRKDDRRRSRLVFAGLPASHRTTTAEYAITPTTRAHLWASATSPDVYVVSVARDDLREMVEAATKALGVMRALGWHVAMSGDADTEDEVIERMAAQESYDALAAAMGEKG